MSTPPPGGPQTPPQQPYPQQPQYPPQYPPAQPYYPQAVPPPKKSNTALIIVLVVVVVVVVLAAVAWYAVTLLFRPVTTSATITGVSFAIQYPGSNHYFGSTTITSCSNCPLQASVASPAQYVLSLSNSDSVAHNVTSVTLTTYQFYLASASPDPSTSSPVVVPAHGTSTITLMIGSTTLSGSGIVTGTIVTT